mmetsp:Transcript_4110/g.9913  ORF Transcript_4110/g.9913 Transcript_4110/m.9913 type:complete len:1275 (-) Transcript_4110:2478-6302(-)
MVAQAQEKRTGPFDDELFETWRTDVMSIADDEASLATSGKGRKKNSDLHQEAKEYFRSLDSKYEEALARLIRDLGPPFMSNNLPSRLRGLYVLLGAIEGCRDKNMSNSCLVLLGDFLTLQCGPIVDDEYEEDYDSMIRDISIQCLSGLVGTPTTSLVEEGKKIAEALVIRVDYARKGVERRCAAADDMDLGVGMGTESEDLFYTKDIRGGLSSLPRSKRSLCFVLLIRAVHGISEVAKSATTLTKQQMQSSHVASIQSHFVQFADFTARCIHGESDPRCLLQLLELLYNTQLTLCDWFLIKSSGNPSLTFPIEEFFDAVAPYYPIQFTPPPNNVHGITREGLHDTLISVLSFTKMDEASREYRKPTMLSCSINLFLEPLLPGPSDEESPSSLEKLESLECISNLLFPIRKQKDGKQPDTAESECLNLSFDEVRSLSSALISTHDEASVGTRHQGGDLSDQNKVLAERCRYLASRVARELEKVNKNGKLGLWERFVSEPLDKEMKKLALTPAFAKTSIAYEASLATSGGPRTLRMCLAKGLGPLLGFLREHIDDSTENTLAAIHGIAAFTSSSNVALSKSLSEGVELTPHPLKPFAGEACNLLLTIVESKVSSQSLSLKTAASSCLECLLVSSLERDLQLDELTERVCNFLKGLLENLLMAKESDIVSDGDELADYRLVSSKILGRIIGLSLSERDDGDLKDATSKSILMVPIVQDYIRKEVFSKLQATAFDEVEGYHGERYDRLALSTACTASAKLASSVVGSHLKTLLHELKGSISSRPTQVCLEALSFALRSSVGENVIRAFHENEVVDDILEVVCNELIGSASAQISDSISQVALTPTNTSKEKLKSKIDVVIGIVGALLPAYNSLVPKERLKKLLKAISDKIPPLSEGDEVVLLVRLPILSAVLQEAEPSLLEDVVSKIDNDEGQPIAQLIQDLTEYVLSDEHLPSARSAGALCVHALLKSGFNRNLDCPTKPLLIDINERFLSSSTGVSGTKNCLNYLSLLGSAAALRGASSSSTADTIAYFLMELACEGKATLPFCSEGRRFTISSLFDKPFVQTAIRLCSSSAYGAIMMEDGMKPLMKQRLTHNFIKFMKKSYGSTNEYMKSSGSSETGLLMVVSNVICASDLSKFDQATTRLLATSLVRGFSSDLFQQSSQLESKLPLEAAKFRTLVISALLKMICICPTVVNRQVLDIVSGLLRSYAIADPSTGVGCKLIALQALQQLSQLDGAKDSILAIKPAVIAILSSAMNKKNGLLRSAAVDVRNVWCLVG